MADKKKSGISVMPVFVDGEQPSAAKFNSIGAQVKRSDYILESSIGDIWGESYPYSTFSDAKLSLDRIKASGTEYIDPSSLGRDLDIASLGRIIGPASYLNVDYSCYDENGIANHQISQNIPKGVNQFTLKYIPSTDPTFTDVTVFANKVANPEDLSSAGDYYVSPVGNVITVTPTDSSASTQAAYKSKPLYWNGGGDEIGAGYNVIPDPAQLSTALTATESHLSFTEESDGVYLVELPKRYRDSGGTENISNTLPSYHLDRGQRYILPIAISLICGASNTAINAESSVSNVEIPQGMIYLKNESTGEVYTEATYYYVSKTKFRIQLSQTLDIGVDVFSVITVGANITSSIRSLRDKYKSHSHSREFGEELISIEDIDGIFKSPGESGIFIPSSNQSNRMPQYLHRDGSRGIDTGLNDDNAMRGDLVIGRRADENGNLITEAGNYLGQGRTFVLKFGDTSSVTSASMYKSYNTASQEGSFNIRADSNELFLYSQRRIFGWSAGEDGIELSATGGNVEVTSSNEVNIIADDSEGIKTSGGLSIGHADSGLPFEARSNVSENAWFHPRIHQVHFEGGNEIVYAYEDRLDTSNGPAASLIAANFLFKNISLPSWLNHNSGCRVIGVEVLWSPGSSHSISSNNGLEAGFDESTQFVETFWYGSNSNYSKNYSTGVAWTLAPGGINLYWPLDTEVTGIGNAIIDPESLFTNSSGEYYARMDYRVTIIYRRV